MAGIMTLVGVLSDTHIPDRVPDLHPKVLQTFRELGVAAILHAGDISVPRVLTELEQIAPVHAVRGNRDILYLRWLPMQLRLNIDNVSIGMTHGHGTFSRYMVDKLQRAVTGRYAGMYIRRILRTFPDVDVVVFGHLHVPCSFHIEGKLIFNPGSTSYPYPRKYPPTFGLLYLEPGKEPRGEIIEIS
jgi:putative phosphoesterase